MSTFVQQNEYYMRVLIDSFGSVVRKQPPDIKKDKNLLFETKWQNSISGNELVQRVHKHIDKIYAQNKQ